MDRSCLEAKQGPDPRCLTKYSALRGAMLEERSLDGTTKASQNSCLETSELPSERQSQSSELTSEVQACLPYSSLETSSSSDWEFDECWK